MSLALEVARQSGDEIPVGALVVSREGKVLAAAHNMKEKNRDPSAHAEIEALRIAANAVNDWRLSEMTLFVTLEPCVMCAGAIREARVERLVFGAYERNFGASGSVYDVLRDSRLGAAIEVVPGISSLECGSLLTEFFKKRRPRSTSSLGGSST